MANHRLPTRRTRRALAWATVALTGLGGGIILPHTAAFGSTQEGGSAGVSDLSCEGFTLYVSGWPQDQQGFAGVNGKSTPFVGGVTIPVTTYQTTPKHYYVSVSVNGDVVYSDEFDTGPCDGPTPDPDPTTASPTPDPTTASPTPASPTTDPTPASPTPDPELDLCKNVDGAQKNESEIPAGWHQLDDGSCVPNEPDPTSPTPSPAPVPAPNPDPNPNPAPAPNPDPNPAPAPNPVLVAPVPQAQPPAPVEDCPPAEQVAAPAENTSGSSNWDYAVNGSDVKRRSAN